MRRSALLPAILLSLAPVAPSVPVHATGTVAGLDSCASYGAINDQVQICSGEVASWDGTSLDVDLTLPQRGSGARHPLIVMLHGFANNKHEWESLTDEGDNHDKWHWNNHWFAEHGFYVLTYTARGFFDNGTTRTDEPATPAGMPVSCASPRPGSACVPNGTIHLKSREFEIRDTEWLAALVAQAFPDLDPDQVAVSGGSYGGGESWLLASQPTWDANSFVTPAPSPRLPVLQLQVAIPKYPWTDLAYSLAPNGHPGPFDATIYSSAQGNPNDPTDTGQGNPLGEAKFSYVTGFFFEGVIQGIFENGTTVTPSQEGPISIPTWATRAVSGDPYDTAGAEDLLVAQIRRGLTEFRGAFYQDEGWTAQAASREVAIFSISGWTDDLFPPVEAFRQFKYLKSLDRLWPVEVAVADVGHPRAQNPRSEWHHLNVQAWGFLNEQLHGSHRQQTEVFSLPTVCGPQPAEDVPIQRLTGRTPEALSNGSLTIDYETPGHLSNRKIPANPLTPDVADPDDLQTDPAFGSAVLGLPNCRSSIAPVTLSTARYTGMSAPLDQSRIYVGLGHVDLTYTLAAATTATLNARVWDVAPDGTALLVTRGTYRIDSPAYNSLTQTIELPLFGNQWTLARGHQVRLDLTQVDYPTFLQSNSETAIITFPDAHLVLPTREATELTIPGAALP
jgi:predicted acyl esterase